MEQACAKLGMMVVTYLFVVIISVVIQSDLVQACTCLPKHPQQHYCDSDYAIRVKIYNQVLKLPNGQRFNISDPKISELPLGELSQSQREWTGHVQKVYKGFSKFTRLSSTVKLYSPFFDSMCGVGTLISDEVYVIVGTFGKRGLNFNFCDWHPQWKTVTSKQRRGLRYWYAENCLCQVDTCGLRHPCGEGTKEDAPTMSCEWDAWHSACTNHHTACVMTSKGCSWHQSKEFAECLKRP
ncbi:metalloproteinase inhibitor 3-like [Diadema setosum]|uniref:metalloproteinase inhibitor 3-like n=1 Tax=Diadema setosum TaxID=31175 RepID=UPI003B3B2F23